MHGGDREAAEAILDIMESGIVPARPAGSAAENAYRLLFGGRFGDALAAVATHEADGRTTAADRAVAAQVRALCTGAADDPVRGDPRDAATLEGALFLFQRSEAAHVSGRIAECTAALSEALPVAPPRARVWMRMGLMRSLLFQGEIAAAEAHAADAAREAGSPVARRSVTCLEALIAGLRGDDRAVEHRAERLRPQILPPTSYADSGIALTTALGLAASHLPQAAADFLRDGTGGAGLPLLPPALRAYGYDVLIEAALASGKLELAAWMMLDFDRLDLGDNAQFVAAREASRARLEIAEGSAAPGRDRADAAMTAALEAGSGLVGARAALIAASIDHAASGHVDAERLAALLAPVTSHDLREWMMRSLAESGRHPRPLPAIGWDRLSPTQEAVARLAARGLRNQEIADVLVISPRTVEGHIGAILDRLGVRGRVDIVRSLDGASRVDPSVLARLTARQARVAEEVVAGASTEQIAARLGIGAKAVEKHLSAIYRRLGANGRASAVARLVGAEPVTGGIARPVPEPASPRSSPRPSPARR